MRLKPNDLPDLELNEVRNVTFNLSGAVGSNTVSTFTVSSDSLSFGTPSISGTTATVKLTAAQTGTHAIKATATLSSGETVIGVIRAKVLDSTRCYEESGNDYD